MKTTRFFLLLLVTLMPLGTLAQRAKQVPLAQINKDQIGDSILAIYNYYDTFRNELSEQLTQTEDTTMINGLLMQFDNVEQRCNQHIFNFCEAYSATSPDALEFIFSLRTMVPKEHIQDIYNSIKGKNKKLPYALLLNAFLETKQVEIGEPAINFEATTFDNQKFSLDSLLNKKNIIIIFGGLDKISAGELRMLTMIYDGVDQSKTEIIYYDPSATAPEQLAAQRTENKLSWNFISDFKGEMSPATLAYNTQGTPTFVCIGHTGLVENWGVGDLQMVINKLAK